MVEHDNHITIAQGGGCACISLLQDDDDRVSFKVTMNDTGSRLCIHIVDQDEAEEVLLIDDDDDTERQTVDTTVNWVDRGDGDEGPDAYISVGFG